MMLFVCLLTALFYVVNTGPIPFQIGLLFISLQGMHMGFGILTAATHLVNELD